MSSMQEILLSIKLALKNLRSNIGRSILSLLGIVIGVAAVIIVLSLGAGLKSFVIGQVESFGTDIFNVEVKVPKTKHTSSQNVGGMVGGTQITTLKIKDAEEIARHPNIRAWYGGIMSQQLVNYRDKNKQTILMGLTAGVVEADEKTQVEAGRMYTEEEDRGLEQLAVLGSDVKESFFGLENAVGKTIKIKGQTYKVVGVLKKRGMTGFFNFDNTIYIPMRTLQKKIMGIDHIQFAIFRLKDTAKTELTILEATDIVRKEHDIKNSDDDDFAITSIVQAKEIVGKVLSVINILLLSLTSISLLVGGVGIMNVMYVAVTERTYEIGLRKSVGAEKGDILKQFLFEAIFLTVMGGFLGVVIGFILSQVAGYFAGRAGFFIQFQITLFSVLLSAGFSAGVGVLFGYWPARRASRLTPMEALRKE